MNNVIHKTVKFHLCSGCGICAAVCPKNCLEMQFNVNGENNPVLIDDCVDCGLCVKMCPFSSDSEDANDLAKKLYADISNIKKTPETGYYLDAIVGHSGKCGHRENGASGGLATYTLETLLNKGMVDYVICPGPNGNKEKLFKFNVCSTVEQIRSCSRSVYYPVEASEVISYVLKKEGKYAIIGLPCLCKAVRQAQLEIPRLADRIKYVLGLVCGQQQSKFFAEYVCAIGGGDPKSLANIRFRVKDSNRPASDFGMYFQCESGKNKEGTIFWTEGMGQAWNDRYFTLNSCNFCDDIFAECADAVFMDAWLPNYSSDWRGHSIVLLRNEELVPLVKNELVSYLKVFDIDIKDVIKSQQGVLDSKRKDIKERIRLSALEDQESSHVRKEMLKKQFEFAKDQVIACQYEASKITGQLWLQADKDIVKFNDSSNWLLDKISRAKKKYMKYRIPNAIIRRIVRKVIK